jgi:ribonuclease P protein component
MLGAGQRMRRRDQFTSALKAGRRARRGVLVVHLGRDAGEHRSSAAAGFIIPRTVGGAVVRNTVRRRLRHLLRDRLAGLPAEALLVVRALPEAGQRSYADLGRDLDAALAAAGRPTPSLTAVATGARSEATGG